MGLRPRLQLLCRAQPSHAALDRRLQSHPTTLSSRRKTTRLQAEQPSWLQQLGVARFTREPIDAHADLADGALPFVVELGIEEDGLVGRCGEPAIGLDLGIELTGAPAGISEREQTLARAGAAGDVAQD